LQKTSFPLEIAARFQLNLLIDPIPRIGMYKDVPRKFMPVLWFEQHVKASDSIASTVKWILFIPTAGQLLGVLLTIVGFTLTVWTIQRRNGPTEILPLNGGGELTKLPETRPLMKN